MNLLKTCFIPIAKPLRGWVPSALRAPVPLSLGVRRSSRRAQHPLKGFKMNIDLVSSSQMGANPRQFYVVAKGPGLLAGMAYPHSIQWHPLYDTGYRYVVCLTDDNPTYDLAPLTLLYGSYLQDLVGGVLPDQPEHEESCIQEAVALIQPHVLAGKGVVVHCAGGTGRTGTVIACTLKALGLPTRAILDHMERVNTARRKYAGWQGWPESPWQREILEHF